MRISDFKLVEYFLRNLCKTYDEPFIDLTLTFDAGPRAVFEDGKIVIGESSRLGQTLLHIFGAYIVALPQLTGHPSLIPTKDQASVINSFVAVIRNFSYSQNCATDMKESITSRLNRDPFVWIVMRDIICPVYDKPLKNLRIVAAKSPYIDTAKLVSAGDFPSSSGVEYPYIFMNLDFESVPVRSAYLLMEAIRGHGLDPKSVLNDVLRKTELTDKVLGLAKAAFTDQDGLNKFIAVISILANYEQSETLLMLDKNSATESGIKSLAQSNNWWYIGLIEKMLTPARGPDWNPYFSLKPLTEELWEKVEIEKKRRGLSELPMELLLRVQSDEYEQKPNLIIQGLLEDSRVW